MWTAIQLLLIAYVAGAAFLYFSQERILFHPRANALLGADVYKKFELYIKRDDVVLQGWFVPREPVNKQPLIIYYGGNAEDISAHLQLLDRYPEASLLFVNYRAYGGSTGKPSQKNLFEDALFVLDHIVVDKGIDSDQIILLGRSLGTGVAVYVARHRPVRAVILVSPYDSILNVGKGRYRIFPVRWLLKHPFEVAPLAAEIDRPLLALLAGQDNTMPEERSRALISAWAGPKQSVYIENADHNSIFGENGYWQAIDNFYKSLWN